MITELEKEFFKVFGIEPIPIKSYGFWLIKGSIAENNKGEKVVYPEITDRKLLEMICILNETSCEVLQSENKEDLKNEILETCIKVYNTPILTSDGDEYDNNAIYDKIQQLFKGGE